MYMANIFKWCKRHCACKAQCREFCLPGNLKYQLLNAVPLRKLVALFKRAVFKMAICITLFSDADEIQFKL